MKVMVMSALPAELAAGLSSLFENSTAIRCVGLFSAGPVINPAHPRLITKLPRTVMSSRQSGATALSACYLLWWNRCKPAGLNEYWRTAERRRIAGSSHPSTHLNRGVRLCECMLSKANTLRVVNKVM